MQLYYIGTRLCNLLVEQGMIQARIDVGPALAV